MLQDDNISILDAFIDFSKSRKTKGHLSDSEIADLTSLAHSYGFGDAKGAGVSKKASKKANILSRHEFEEIISNFTDKERKV